MAKPTAAQLAAALGVSGEQIRQLAKRGMPIHKTDKAREWFKQHGFDSVPHRKSGGAERKLVTISRQLNSKLGGVMKRV